MCFTDGRMYMVQMDGVMPRFCHTSSSLSIKLIPNSESQVTCSTKAFYNGPVHHVHVAVKTEFIANYRTVLYVFFLK